MTDRITEAVRAAEAVARVRAYVRNRWDAGEYSNPCISIFTDNADHTKSHSLTESDLRALLAHLDALTAERDMWRMKYATAPSLVVRSTQAPSPARLPGDAQG